MYVGYIIGQGTGLSGLGGLTAPLTDGLTTPLTDGLAAPFTGKRKKNVREENNTVVRMCNNRSVTSSKRKLPILRKENRRDRIESIQRVLTISGAAMITGD